MSMGLLKPGVELRDVIWQRIIEGGYDDAEHGAVIEQEARWRWGLMRGKSHMTMLVRVNDEDTSVSFNLVKPMSTDVASAASASSAKTSATSASSSSADDDNDEDAETERVAAAAAKQAGGKSSALLQEYTGVIKVTTAADGGGGGGGDVVVSIRGKARMRDMGFGARVIGGRVMCGVLKGQVTRTLSDVVGVACDESIIAEGAQLG